MQNALFTQKPSIIAHRQRPDDELSISDTPDAAVKKFIKSNSHLARTTLEFYQHALNRFIAFCSTHGIHLIPDDLTADRIPAYIAYLKSTGAGGRTIQQYLNVLKIMMRSRGFELKATYRLPSDERKENKVKAMERWFTEEEVQACLDYRKGPVRNQLIIRLLVETGARVQELASLKAHEIDLATRTAWIKTSKTMPRPVFFSDATAKLLEHTISYTKVTAQVIF